MAERQSPELAALVGLDKLLEHRIRLAICVLLARSDAITFSRFKELLGETDGSLGANLQRLEEAGYILPRKSFLDRKPATWYALTADGRRALTRHLDAFDALTRHGGSDESLRPRRDHRVDSGGAAPTATNDQSRARGIRCASPID